MTAASSETAESKTGDEPVVEKLYAGKYKTPEEMEAAIIGKDQEYGKLRQTHEDLKKEHSSISAVPENYIVPTGIEIPQSEIDTLVEAAKTAQLPQEKFDKLAREIAAKRKAALDTIESTKKEIGETNVTLLEDYVKKHYPESLHKTVLDKLIMDKPAREDALKHREKLLNNRAPGMSNADPGKSEKKSEAYDGQRELQELAQKQQAAKHDRRLRDKLIETAREIGEARFKKG